MSGIEEYHSLQSLHQWKVNEVSPTEMELVFADQIKLTMRCVDIVPDLDSAVVGLTELEDVKTRYPLESTRNLFAVFQSAVAKLPSEGYSTLPRVSDSGLLSERVNEDEIEIGLC